MTNRWLGLTIDCADPARLSSFWGTLLDLAPSAEHGDDPGWATLGTRRPSTTAYLSARAGGEDLEGAASSRC
ncbi:VOC family protein [Mycobacterium sp. D16R24]|uniref:VOC family protein n=1 Tax=Mycobacterium sp. D16R24 TaxID=1855656 RepID=UPI00336ACD90